jgi:hypothetical protein
MRCIELGIATANPFLLGTGMLAEFMSAAAGAMNRPPLPSGAAVLPLAPPRGEVVSLHDAREAVLPIFNSHFRKT